MARTAPISSTPAVSQPRVSPQPRPRRRLEAAARWSFLMPVLLLNLLVIGIPSIIGILYSFTEWSGYGDPVFVGLANFNRLFQDGTFFQIVI